MAKDYDITTIKKAIKGTGGLYTQIAKKLGCEWHTAKKYVESFEETLEAYNNESEAVIDLAESKLIENINDNDNTAIIFYLKCKAKDRGYSESQEIKLQLDSEPKINLSINSKPIDLSSK